MSLSDLVIIKTLTPEQEALIPVYREKWRKIAVSTKPIDRRKVTEAIDAVYAAIGLYKPRFIFYDSPYAGLGQMDKRLENLSKKRLYTILHKQWKKQCVFPGDSPLISKLFNGLKRQLKRQIGRQIYEQLDQQLRRQLEEQLIQIEHLLSRQMESQLYGLDYLEMLNQINRPETNIYQDITPLEDLLQISVKSELLACYASLYDFCISVLNLTCPPNEWEAYQLLVKHCGWVTPFENIAIVCDRPQILSFDSQNRLHAEGSPAIQFADGFSVYCYHGVLLTEQYGKVHPNEWRSQWLLEEENAEVRRVLIQGIGYERICQELQAIELDSWQEYALLKINAWIDVEPMYLLKMTCPSTGHIHVLRVPPNIQSARAAISWVNWGVDPEDFSVQT